LLDLVELASSDGITDLNIPLERHQDAGTIKGSVLEILLDEIR
jgi:hypothetical protein